MYILMSVDDDDNDDNATARFFEEMARSREDQTHYS